MILVPQIYVKSGQAVRLENTSMTMFSEDAFALARAMQEAGTEMVHITDLNVTAVGAGVNVPIIKEITQALDMRIVVGGAFRNTQSIDTYIKLDAEAIVFDSYAYQQPQLVTEACSQYPGKIAVHIDSRDGRVTIPGWTVAANKTALDYVERFGEQGVKTFFYSNMTIDEKTTDENLKEILMFCKKAGSTVYCTNEIYDMNDIVKFVTLGAPRLEGLILGRSIYQGRIDLRGANAFVADLVQDSNNEPTMQDM